MKNILLLVLFFCIACQPYSKKKDISIESIAKTKYGSNIHYLSNKNDTYTICYSQKEKTAQNPFPALKFFVYDNKKAEQLFEDNLAKASIKWVGKYKFKVEIVPGIVSIDHEKESNSYIYDVQLRKKIK